MNTRSLSHLSDDVLLREMRDIVARDHALTAELLACLAEVDARRLYRPAGYPTMSAYCIRELRFSEDMAWKRIQAARAARAFPAILDMLSDGRLHLSAVCMLTPHLTRHTAADLLDAACGKTKSEIELLIAQRFPSTERLEMVVQIPARPNWSPAPGQVGMPDPNAGVPPLPVEGANSSPAPGQVDMSAPSAGAPPLLEGGANWLPAPGQVGMPNPSAGVPPLPVGGANSSPAPGQVNASSPRPTVKPVAYERFAVEFMMDRAMHEDLRRAQALLGHQVPAGELGRVFGRALQSLIRELEKNKFGVGRSGADAKPRAVDRASTDTKPGAVDQGSTDTRPGAVNHAGTSPRYVPKTVRRSVWERDQGRCTFVSEAGLRCPATSALEFDHIEPVARGGASTVENLRLRCRTHNQLEAEREFGAVFMDEMRERATPGQA